MFQMPNGSMIEGEVYNVETAKETAEAEHISSAEQEEKKTFVITGTYMVEYATSLIFSLN